MKSVSEKPVESLKTPPQAAEFLAISPRKLWALTASGEIPRVKIGRLVRYCHEDLVSWIDQKKQGGEA